MSAIANIDLRLVAQCDGDLALAAVAQRNYERQQRAIALFSREVTHAKRMEKAYRADVDSWKDRCAEIRAQAWRDGRPQEYTLPPCPKPPRLYF